MPFELVWEWIVCRDQIEDRNFDGVAPTNRRSFSRDQTDTIFDYVF